MITPEISSLLRRGVAEVIVESEMKKLLESGRPLRLKQGFDPSCPDIHLGHAVGLRKLRQFQQMGHQVVLIVGDWTAQIGDPSGRSVMRPMLSAEEVRVNAQTYMEQFFKVVDEKKTEVRWQSEWFGKFGLDDIIKLTGKFTVAQMLAREDFNKRYTDGHPIAITELLYPLLQAYDSVVIEADVEFGGIDQKFNCLLGRELQALMGQVPQQLLLVPLLVGTEGSKKMSKSLGNYIGVDESPSDIFGKTMSIPDHLIIDYFELLTDVPDEELKEFKQQIDSQSVNPMDLKKRLAREIVTQFHDAGSAQEAEGHFARTVQRKELPEDIPQYAASFQNIPIEFTTISGLISDGMCLASSRSEVKRLIASGSVKVDGKKVSSDMALKYHNGQLIFGGWTTTPETIVPSISNGSVITVGKRRFIRIIDTDG